MVGTEYGVIDSATGIVFAKAIWLAGRLKPLKLNNIKVAIVDYDGEDGPIIKVLNCYLSSSKGTIEKTYTLEQDAYITESSHPYYKNMCDYIFLSRNVEELISQLENQDV